MVSSSVEVPAVRPTVASPLNQAGSRSEGGLHVDHGTTPLPAEIDEFSRVIGVPASHDDNGVHALQQPLERR